MKSAVITLLAIQFFLTSSASVWAQDTQVKTAATSGTPARWGEMPDDPWNSGGGTSPGWPNTGPSNPLDPNAGWGGTDPSNPGYDPNAFGSSSYSGYQSFNAMDGIVEFAIQTSGLLTENYYQYVGELRKKAAYDDNDDKLADEIIKNATWEASQDSTGSALLFTAGAYNLKLNPNSAGGTLGFTVGFMGQLGYDFYTTFKTQGRMILELAALYGQLPTNPRARVRLIKNMFVLSAVASTIETKGQSSIQKALERKFHVASTEPTPPPGPGPNPFELGTAAAAQSVEKTIVSEADKAALAKLMGDVSNASPEVQKAITNEMLKTEAGSMVLAAKMANMVERAPKPVKYAEGKKLAAAGISAGVVAALSAVIDGTTTWHFGNKLKAQFKASQKDNIASAIYFVKTDPQARQTLWLLLTRDIFRKSLQTSSEVQKNYLIRENKRFATVLSTTIPLASTKMANEQDVIMAAFNADPKIIDKNLVSLRDTMSTEAKLYFMYILISGWFVKGMMTPDDITSMNTVATYLGLKPPPTVKLAPGDARNDEVSRFLTMRVLLQKKVYKRFEIVHAHAEGRTSEPLPPTITKGGSTGSIILEDFVNARDLIKKLDLDRANEGKLTPQQIQINQDLAKKQLEELMKANDPGAMPSADALKNAADKHTQDLKDTEDLWGVPTPSPAASAASSASAPKAASAPASGASAPKKK